MIFPPVELISRRTANVRLPDTCVDQQKSRLWCDRTRRQRNFDVHGWTSITSWGCVMTTSALSTSQTMLALMNASVVISFEPFRGRAQKWGPIISFDVSTNPKQEASSSNRLITIERRLIFFKCCEETNTTQASWMDKKIKWTKKRIRNSCLENLTKLAIEMIRNHTWDQGKVSHPKQYRRCLKRFWAPFDLILPGNSSN